MRTPLQVVRSNGKKPEPSRLEDGMKNRFLIFRLGGQEFAVEAARVRDIQHLRGAALAIAPSEGRPPSLTLNMPLNGKTIPVLSLHQLFGLHRTAANARNCLVVIETQERPNARLVGIVVDSVSRVELVSSRHQQPPPGDCPFNPQYLWGRIRLGEKWRPVIDVDRILNGGPQASVVAG